MWLSTTPCHIIHEYSDPQGVKASLWFAFSEIIKWITGWKEKERIDRSLLSSYSNPVGEFQGSYSDSDFASLLVSSLFSDSYYFRYGAFIILEPWIHSSPSFKELFSSIPPSFISLLTQCPTKKEGENDWLFIDRLRPFLVSLIPTGKEGEDEYFDFEVDD